MLRNNLNTICYADPYMFFTFNGIHSAKYNLLIENKNDLKIENSIGASSEFTSAMFQEGTYYLGTKRTQKTFKRKCAAEGITLSQYKQMMLWLTPGTTGFLTFDFNPWWGWEVVLDTVGDATFMDRNDKLLVEFELTFKTIGSYLARNYYETSLCFDEVKDPVEDDSGATTCNGYLDSTAFSNEYHIPVILMYSQDSEQNIYTLNILGINNAHQHLDYNCYVRTDIGTFFTVGTSNEGGIIKYVDTRLSANSSQDLFKWLGESNLVLLQDELIELSDTLIFNSQPEGIMQLNSKPPELIYPEIYSNYIKLTEKDIQQLQYNYYNCVCLTREKQKGSSFDTDEWGENAFSPQYETYVLYGEDLSSNLDSSINSGYQLNYDSNITSGYIYTESSSINSDFVDLQSLFLALPEGISLENYDTRPFTCYLAYGNLVQIQCNGTNAEVYVTSCNNL